VKRCVYDIQVLKLTYGEIQVVPEIVGIKIIKNFHGVSSLHQYNSLSPFAEIFK
jgi:hypothetical protein